MSTSSTNQQIRSELAEDVIGAYIGRIGSEISRVNGAYQQSRSVHLGAAIHWLKAERKNAAVDRARLYEYQEDPDGLEALIELYKGKLAAIEQGRKPGLSLDHAYLREVLVESATGKTV